MLQLFTLEQQLSLFITHSSSQFFEKSEKNSEQRKKTFRRSKFITTAAAVAFSCAMRVLNAYVLLRSTQCVQPQRVCMLFNKSSSLQSVDSGRNNKK